MVALLAAAADWAEEQQHPLYHQLSGKPPWASFRQGHWPERSTTLAFRESFSTASPEARQEAAC